MKTRMTRLGAFAVFAVSLAVFTGSAIASNGHGKGTAPGQVKKSETPAAQATTSTQASTQTTATVTASSSTQGNSANTPGQKKKAAATASTTATPTTSTGMKPSSSTTAHKWTSCTTGGGSGSTATCTRNTAAATSAAKPTPDQSKQYGQGKTTAAQIVNSRGGSGAHLTGPGNSQPHKVAVCPHKKNRSGGVDVHAIKSYSTASCAQQPSAHQQTQVTATCLGTTLVTTSTSSQVAAANKRGRTFVQGNAGLHGKHKGLKTSTSTSTTTTTTFTPSTAACAQAKASVAATTSVAAPTSVTTAAPTTAAGITASGALGAHATVAGRAHGHASAGGVLGAVTRLGRAGTRTTLPFTGFSLWIAVLIALGLIGGGFALRAGRAHAG